MTDTDRKSKKSNSIKESRTVKMSDIINESTDNMHDSKVKEDKDNDNDSKATHSLASQSEEWEYLIQERDEELEREEQELIESCKPKKTRDFQNFRNLSERFQIFKNEFTVADEPRVLFSQLPKFKHEYGPQNLPADITPVTLFELFFPPEFIDYVVVQTNIYRESYLNSLKPTHQNIKALKFPINAGDIYGYLSCFLLMGILRCLNSRDHWSKHAFLSTPVKKIMTYNRFAIVAKFLHLMDNKDDDSSKLYKIKCLEDIIEKWRIYYQPGKNITLDETIIPFYGKSSLKMYNDNKPEPEGLKAFTLCDSYTNYCLEFQLYTGAHFTQGHKQKYKTTFNNAIAMDMSRNYWYKNHYIFVDSYFNSCELAKFLLDKNTYITGTMRLTKPEQEYCEKLIGKENEKTYYAYMVSDYANIYRLKNNPNSGKTAWMLSSVFGDTKVRQDNGRYYPESVKEYNSNRSGVDVLNRMLTSYRNLNTIRKWWKAVFAEILDITIINCYIIYQNYDHKITHKDFRLALVEYFSTKYVTPNVVNKQYTKDIPRAPTVRKKLHNRTWYEHRGIEPGQEHLAKDFKKKVKKRNRRKRCDIPEEEKEKNKRPKRRYAARRRKDEEALNKRLNGESTTTGGSMDPKRSEIFKRTEQKVDDLLNASNGNIKVDSSHTSTESKDKLKRPRIRRVVKADENLTPEEKKVQIEFRKVEQIIYNIDLGLKEI